MSKSPYVLGEGFLPVMPEDAMPEKEDGAIQNELSRLDAAGDKIGTALTLAGHYCKIGEFRRARQVLFPYKEEVYHFLSQSPFFFE